MTSFCIASSKVSHSLIETGILWSLSLTKNPESMRANPAGSGARARHENEPLEEVDVLFVLEQRPVERRDNGLAVLGPHGFGRDVLGEQELQPIEELGSGGLLLQAGHFAHLEEHFERFAQERFLQSREMHLDDFLHRFLVRETDVVKETTAQEGVGQLLFVVRGDEHYRALLRLDELLGL